LTENTFILDERLEADCYQLGRFQFCRLLLSKNAAVPWFILVPETQYTELFELSEKEQQSLQIEINLVSKFVKDTFDVTKLNVAAIGNIVSQMHIHIVGRHPADYCWPGVVWGVASESEYRDEQVTQLIDALNKKLPDSFT